MVTHDIFFVKYFIAYG